MIQKIRRMVARAVATLVTLLTLGRVRVDPTGAQHTTASHEAPPFSRVVR